MVSGMTCCVIFWLNYITSKTNKTLRFLRRNLKIPSIRINEQAYFTLARPLVENASTAWDPYTQTDINKVEAVQRRAARYVANNHRNRVVCLSGFSDWWN
jgi:protein involved in ribonucleotide reduction